MLAWKTFEDLYGFTDTISAPTAYENNECRGLYNALHLTPRNGLIVEVGCQFGRSTSIIAAVAKELNCRLVLVDPYEAETEGEPHVSLVRMLKRIGHPYILYCMKTSDLPTTAYEMRPDFVHIDGDHTAGGVDTDCHYWLPRIKSGGLAAFHDYERESLPDVKQVVDFHTQYGWTEHLTSGSLRVMHKI